MRIRSIKPEFWRSDDIAALELEDRLLFVGLWSYVDDNGVGVDKLAAITADLFAHDLERDPRETFARVSRGLSNLFDAGLIARYGVGGRQFLAVTGWSKHQRVDKPNKARYPAPDQGIASVSRESREGVARSSRLEQGNRGTGEQGNRGTGEQSSDAVGADVVEKYTPEIRALCDRVAEMVCANGHPVGEVGKSWWQACDRLVRLDGYSLEQVEIVARWATSDEFWAANIRSMSKLREKFSTLRAQRNTAIARTKPAPIERARNVIEMGARMQAAIEARPLAVES